MGLANALRGILDQQPKEEESGALATVPLSQVGLLGALYQNPLMQQKIANQRAANPRTDATDFMGYGPDWGSYLANLNRNLQAQLPQLTDSGEQMAQKGAAMFGNFAPFGITAFHGTPHKFEKFDMSKVGTGEGALAYGHGLYFAENPLVASEYSKKLGGDTMKVDIPDQHIAKMVDWDAPLSQQPHLQEIATKLGVKPRVNVASRPDLGEYHFVDSIGADLVDAAIAKFGKEGASNFLKQQGIPGIKYLDQGSRAGGKGTSNFVVFDDSLPKVLP